MRSFQSRLVRVSTPLRENWVRAWILLKSQNVILRVSSCRILCFCSLFSHLGVKQLFSLVFAFVFFGVLVTSTIRANLHCWSRNRKRSSVLPCFQYSYCLLWSEKSGYISFIVLDLFVSVFYKRKQKRERERERGLSWHLKNHWNLAAENAALGNISKPHRNQLKIQIPSIGVGIVSYIKFGLILILISWGGFSIFISAAETPP